MIRSCLHPLCHKQMKRSRACCGRHYHQLSEHLRDEMKRAEKSHDQGYIGQVEEQWLEFFRARTIGKHEIVKCRGASCGEDVVWLTNAARKPFLVRADTVGADDIHYDPAKHVEHRRVCPDQADIPRSRA